MDKSLSVTELTLLIKDTLATNFNTLDIVGEISNFKPSKNNVFFTLKDEDASINVVMWNYLSKIEGLDIKDGKKVKIRGNLTIFQKSGQYNINCFNIELLGQGDLHQQYLDLKEKFTKAGYFDESKKKPLPDIIDSIGIITATTGAALQDFLYVIKKNGFTGKIYIKNSAVQGLNCPNNVSEAIEELDKLNLDLIIVARGGGSFEDLFGFSHEKVVLALHLAKTCTISAIGHEIDFMLSDFAADIRAPTPSIAGEIVSKKKLFDISELLDIKETIKKTIMNKIENQQLHLDNCKSLLGSKDQHIDKLIQDIDLLKARFLINISNKLTCFNNILNNSKSIMDKQKKDDITIFHKNIQITSLADINNIKGIKKLTIRFHDGESIVKVLE